MSEPPRPVSDERSGGGPTTLVDSHGRITRACRSAPSALGVDRNAVVGAAFADLIAPMWKADADKLLRNRTGDTVILVPQARLPERGAVACSAIPHHTGGAELTLLDVTELYQRAFDGDQLFHVSFDLVCIAALDGHFLRVSPSFTTALGWSEDELLSQPFVNFVHPDDVEMTLGEMDELAEGRMVHRFENRYRTRSGGWRVLQWTAFVDEDTAQIYAIARDVTKERAVREQLRRARDLAESANRAKGSFIANMSHELRTPLSAILGYSEMLIEDAVDEEMADDLRRINDAGQQLLDLINGLLDLSKMEAGQIEVFIEPVPVGELLEQVEATVRPQVERNGNELRFDARSEIVLETDRRKLQQILLNLLANAGKFTRDGIVSLTLREEPTHLEFEVRDTGIGMSRNEISRVFAPFDQANPDISRTYGGTGLGLAIASRFAVLIGATLAADSEPGAGSTFTLVVPREHDRTDLAVDVTGGYIALVDS